MLGRSLAEELLTVHRCYAPSIIPLMSEFEIKGMAHITGGGFYDNIPRILPVDCSVTVERRTWPVPPIFTLIQERGQIADPEMFRTFNMGIGLIHCGARTGSTPCASIELVGQISPTSSVTSTGVYTR